MSPWDMVAELGIYTDEQIDEMTLAECEEIILEHECGMCPEGDCDCEPESCL
jgi:hypothetical protein